MTRAALAGLLGYLTYSTMMGGRGLPGPEPPLLVRRRESAPALSQVTCVARITDSQTQLAVCPPSTTYVYAWEGGKWVPCAARRTVTSRHEVGLLTVAARGRLLVVTPHAPPYFQYLIFPDEVETVVSEAPPHYHVPPPVPAVLTVEKAASDGLSTMVSVSTSFEGIHWVQTGASRCFGVSVQRTRTL